MKRAAVHQIMPAFHYGDALGNQAMRIRELLRSWGYSSQVYADTLDRRLEDPGRHFTHYSGHADDVVLLHLAIGSRVTAYARNLPGRVIPYYHNVTPPEFLHGYDDNLASFLESGRRELALFKDAPFALAASDYNREEMLELSFRHVEVLPYFITFDALEASAESPAGRSISRRYDDGRVNILFVGRLAPNKRQEDLIRAFNAYHDLINPGSRLLLVGSDSIAPGYRPELEVLADILGVAEDVHMPGPVGPREGLGGYYRAADLFLCMSEHEGFCIPLVEAMAFDVPVVAYRSTGVPCAMGGAGVMVNAKRYDLIAELIDMLVRDQGLREKVTTGQRHRLDELTPVRFSQELRACIKKITGQEPDGHQARA
jgi:glycosyltransferase involved in cell wall biosynthesis